MDHEIANILQAVCYSLAAFGGIYAIAKYSFLRKKSNNETYVARTHANMEASKFENELSKERLKMMNSSEYQEYQNKRFEAMEEFVEKHPESVDWDTNVIRSIIDAVVGSNPIKYYAKDRE